MERREFVLGQSVRRIDAVGKVTGETPYPGDVDMEDQLWMKIRFTDRVHARITVIDTSRAEAYPGVVAVFTAKDVPMNEYGLIMPDQPVLCGPGSGKEDADIVRCVSDQVALVIAETEVIAAAAAKLIDVTYEDLPVLTIWWTRWRTAHRNFIATPITTCWCTTASGMVISTRAGKQRRCGGRGRVPHRLPGTRLSSAGSRDRLHR